MNNNAYTANDLTTFDTVLGVTQFGLYLTLKGSYLLNIRKKKWPLCKYFQWHLQRW